MYTVSRCSMESKYSYEVFNVNEKNFGYAISKNGIQIIHQEHIPGLSGNHRFRNRKSTEEVAELMIRKLKQGEFPPTVSQAELSELGLYKAK